MHHHHQDHLSLKSFSSTKQAQVNTIRFSTKGNKAALKECGEACIVTSCWDSICLAMVILNRYSYILQFVGSSVAQTVMLVKDVLYPLFLLNVRSSIVNCYNYSLKLNVWLIIKDCNPSPTIASVFLVTTWPTSPNLLQRGFFVVTYLFGPCRISTVVSNNIFSQGCGCSDDCVLLHFHATWVSVVGAFCSIKAAHENAQRHRQLVI
jgi:hypothetical protein